MGRRFVPPLTAVPLAINEEPWRERPRIARWEPLPHLFWGRSRHGSRWLSFGAMAERLHGGIARA